MRFFKIYISGENNVVSERALREIYLKGFEMTVKWYYLSTSGDMSIDTTINDYNIDSNGVWLY